METPALAARENLYCLRQVLPKLPLIALAVDSAGASPVIRLAGQGRTAWADPSDAEHRDALVRVLESCLVGCFDSAPAGAALAPWRLPAPRAIDLKALALLSLGLAPGACDLADVCAALDVERPGAGRDERLTAAGECALRLADRLERSGDAGDRAVAVLESRLAWVLGDIEARGVAVDPAAVDAAARAFSGERDQERARLDNLLGGHAARDLFGQVAINYDDEAALLPLLRKAGIDLPDTHNETLDAAETAVTSHLLALRKAAQTLRTLRGLHAAVRDGRVHPHWISLGSTSGRMACRDPNLQGMPASDAVRRLFHAPPGRAIVTADFATCELRVLAALSDDAVLIGAFNAGRDIHAEVARLVFGKPVSKTENAGLRQSAKAISFGLCYGMGAAGLALRLRCGENEALDLMRRYFRAMPRVAEYLTEIETRALRGDELRTALGRRLPLQPFDARDPRDIARIKRLARNLPIQGTAADIFKRAILNAAERLREFDAGADGWRCGVVNMVHDELVVEVPRDAAAQWAAAVREAMEHAGRAMLGDTPIAVDLAAGAFWGDAAV